MVKQLEKLSGAKDISLPFNRRALTKIKKKTTHGVQQLFLLFFAFVQLFPLYWLVTFSFKSNQEIFAGNIIGLPERLRWENYSSALQNGDILLYLFNSVLVTTVTVFLTCFFGAMAAFAITRMKWRFSQTTLNVILLGAMVPLHAVLLPLFIVLNRMGILNSHISLILPYTAFALPLAIFIFAGFLETIPREYEEAACLDGCNIYQVFLVIIMPLLKPALATVGIFTFLSTWNELMFAVTFISERQFRTLTVGMMSFVGQYYTNWGAVGASLLIAVLPMIVVYIFMSKQIQASFRASGLKG